MSAPDNSQKQQGNTASARLLQLRQQSSLSLDESAKKIGLRPDHLRALEAGKWDDLPGDAYVRAYLISLAQHYKLERNELLDLYDSEKGIKRNDSLAHLPFDDGEPVSGKHSSSALLLVLTALAVALAIFYSLQPQNDEQPDPLPSAEQPLPEPAAVEEVPFEEPLETELDSALQPEEKEKEPEEKESSGAVSSSAISSLATISSSAVEKPAPKGLPTTLKVSCDKDSAWIEIRSSGEPTWAVWVRENGLSYTRTYRDTIKIRTGQGELLRYELNGKPFNTPETSSFSLFNGQLVR